MQDNKDTRLTLFNNLEIIKRIIPTDRQVKIINFVGANGHMTSAGVADELGISIASASTQLKSLYEKGWLARTDAGNESGGSEYLYRTIFSLDF